MRILKPQLRIYRQGTLMMSISLLLEIKSEKSNGLKKKIKMLKPTIIIYTCTSKKRSVWRRMKMIINWPPQSKSINPTTTQLWGFPKILENKTRKHFLITVGIMIKAFVKMKNLHRIGWKKDRRWVWISSVYRRFSHLLFTTSLTRWNP